mmetsp:Transcript_51308/g.115366  ORF Transcript_51308/g.115366 Transcript_51308/m.115366 type:complete len:203 (-) Transcript_51308:721-1329(-)
MIFRSPACFCLQDLVRREPADRIGHPVLQIITAHLRDAAVVEGHAPNLPSLKLSSQEDRQAKGSCHGSGQEDHRDDHRRAGPSGPVPGPGQGPAYRARTPGRHLNHRRWRWRRRRRRRRLPWDRRERLVHVQHADRPEGVPHRHARRPDILLATHPRGSLWAVPLESGTAKIPAEGDVEDEAHVHEVARRTHVRSQAEIGVW